MRKIICILLITTGYSASAQFGDFLSPLFKHVKGGVFTVSSFQQADSFNTAAGRLRPLSFSNCRYGISFLISIKDEKKDALEPIKRTTTFNSGDTVVKIEAKINEEEPTSKSYFKSIFCLTKEDKFTDNVTLALGYEYSPSYKFEIDKGAPSASTSLKGLYAGMFLRLLAGQTKEISCLGSINSQLFVGACMKMLSVSEATARIFDDSIPHQDTRTLHSISYSSEVTYSPELYVGAAINHIFFDLSWQWIKFNAISYKSADGAPISVYKYATLPDHLSSRVFHFTIGISLGTSIFSGSEK